MSDFFYRARVEQQLRDANASLDQINAHVWEQNQPAAVRAALHEDRAKKAHAQAIGIRVVFGLAAAWVVLSLVFGRSGQHLFGSLLSFALDAVGVLLVVGGFLWAGSLLVRGGRAIGRMGRRGGTEELP